MSGFNILPDPNKFRLEPGALVLQVTVNYGLQYNGYAVLDSRNICSAGWHVPSFSELVILQAYIGNYLQGGKLKEVGTLYWDAPNTNATNIMGFNLRGGGYRICQTGTSFFMSFKQYGVLWSTTASVPPLVDLMACRHNNGEFRYHSGNIVDGYSIRPLKDSTTLAHGQTGTYTGNDGKVYRTICIGTQEWLADNLVETLYRDLSPIPEVTDAATWAALATGARCSYNNDENNAL